MEEKPRQELQIVLDLTGQPLTCTNKEALEWFNKGVVAFVSVRESPLPYFEKALQLDDSLVLVHSMLVSTCAQLVDNITLASLYNFGFMLSHIGSFWYDRPSISN